jgi:hypothetical protein
MIVAGGAADTTAAEKYPEQESPHVFFEENLANTTFVLHYKPLRFSGTPCAFRPQNSPNFPGLIKRLIAVVSGLVG